MNANEQPRPELVPIGEYIGAYRVVGHVAEGGMASVYRGLNEEINKQVAIKVMHPALNSKPLMASRFLNEVKLVNQIQNPGIVNIFDFGKTSSGLLYLVMEFLDGVPLSGLFVRKDKLPISNLVILFQQISLALVAVHERMIIHRDLKPSNVMVVPDLAVPGGLRAKILDFGIAKLMEISDETPSLRTEAGVLIGTPAFMAPEQIQDPSQVSFCSDVYALGIMLYEALAGQLPFKGTDLNVMLQNMTMPVPALPTESGQVPVELAALVAKMTQRDPAQRPTMPQVAEALGDYLAQHAEQLMSASLDLDAERRTAQRSGALAISLLSSRTSHSWQSLRQDKTRVPSWPKVGAAALLVLITVLGVAGGLRHSGRAVQASATLPPAPAPAPAPAPSPAPAPAPLLSSLPIAMAPVPQPPSIDPAAAAATPGSVTGEDPPIAGVVLPSPRKDLHRPLRRPTRAGVQQPAQARAPASAVPPATRAPQVSPPEISDDDIPQLN